MSSQSKDKMDSFLVTLQAKDRLAEKVIADSKFVVVYLLQQDGDNPGWRKANIEGPVYLVRRRGLPKFQLLVPDKSGGDGISDFLHPDIELDCQKNYVFYKMEDPNQRIRGLWFHEDQERLKIEVQLEKALEELRADQREAPASEQDMAKASADAWQVSANSEVDRADANENVYQQFGLTSAQGGGVQAGTDNATTGSGKSFSTGDKSSGAEETVTLSKASLRRALHSLADSDEFVDLLFQRLRLKAAEGGSA